MEAVNEQAIYPVGRYETPGNYSPELKDQWITAIEVLPQMLELSIENLDAAQLHTSYREGGWTIHQVVHHVADSHINAYIRLKLALTEDNPTIKPYDQDLWAVLPDVEALPVNISITLLHALHIRLVKVLRSMKQEDFERTYFHPEHQRNIPLWEMVAMYAWHGRHHTEQIRGLRQRNGW